MKTRMLDPAHRLPGTPTPKMAIHAHTPAARPEPERWPFRKRLAAPLVVLAGVSLSAVGFSSERRLEEVRWRAGFERAAAARVSALRHAVADMTHDLEALRSFYAASREVDRAQFRTFAGQLRSGHRETQALEWVPLVHDGERASYERAARRDGFPAFRITQRKDQGAMVPAPRRPDYLPVFFVEPYEGNQAALGYDLASSPGRRETLEKARATGGVVATSRVTLVQERARQSGILVVLAVGGGDRTGAAGRGPEGFVVGVYRVGDILKRTLADLGPGIDVHLYDDSASGDERFLSSYSSRTGSARAAPAAAEDELAKGPSHVDALRVGDRTWRVVCTPTAELLAASRTWRPWVLPGAGLLVTGLVASYLVLVLMRAARARAHAAQLLRAKGDLEREVAERRRAVETGQRYHRALVTLSQCNEALVRAVDEPSLLDAVCRAVVGGGGYRMCWVGFAEDDERKTVRPVAQAGHEDGYLSTIDIVWSDTERGRGPTGAAIRTGRAVVARDLGTDPTFAPWRAEASARGYASMVALPVTCEGRTFGALMIHAAETDAFDDDEMKLLGELASDLAYGISALRGRAERARMTAQLMEADRLVAMGTLAAGVAHEINNPLTYVTAALDFLQKEWAVLRHRLPPGSLDEVDQALTEAREGAGRVKHVVRDLKTFSRADEERRGPVDLQRVIESSLNMAWNEIKHRARLVKDFGSTPPVLGNEARVGQVFLNLILNAAQAIPEGRADENEIRLVTRTDGTGRAVVEVRDTGSGIPGEIVGRIFDPFFTTKPVGVGTGLGLSICRSIVADLGGEIAVESEVARGTVFRVALPPAPAEADEAQPERTPMRTGRQGRVLVVDDEPLVGGAVRRALASDHAVEVVTKAREVRERITRGERFDAIVCDLMMPEMTGMDLHAELAALAPDQAERMLLLTGGAFTARARQFLDQVPNPRVEKPFDPASLRALVRGLVR